MVNKSSSVPMYMQIAQDLEQRIHSGELASGVKLGSERELGQTYEVSRITIRQAIALLEQKGLIYTVQGKGTYVQPTTIHQSLMHVTSFHKSLQEKGLRGSTTVLSYEESIRDVETFRMHSITEWDNLCSMKILGMGNGHPVVYYHSLLRKDIGRQMCPHALRMSEMGEAFSTFDLYEVIEQPICRIEQEIFAENAPTPISLLLKINRGDAVLRLESILFDEFQQIMEYKIGYYRADMYSFQLLRSI